MIPFVINYILITITVYYHTFDCALTTRIYSTVHAILAVIFATAYLRYGLLYSALIDNSLGYALYDTIVILLLHRKLQSEPLMFAHHLLFIGGIYMFSNVYPDYIATGLLMEVSNVFLNWSWYMYTRKQTKTKLFKAVVIMLLITYFVFRIGILAYLVYVAVFTLDSVPAELFTIALFCMNCIWFKKLFCKGLQVC